MTYQNDPKISPDRPLEPAIKHRTIETWGTGNIVMASLAAGAVVLGLFYFIVNRDDPATANRTENSPAVTTTAPATNPPAARETTGNTPGGASTTPAKPFPAPANR